MSNKQIYLFTLTITPVQSFISQARKAKDLFAGSEILSSLMRETINKFKEDGEIIFPQNTDFVSNKFVGKLNKTEEEVKKIGEELEKKINSKFINSIFTETCQYSRSLENFFNVFWVAVELEDDNYQKSYKKLEQNLGAVKNLRTFIQIGQLAGKSKCVLCGERNQAKEDDGDKLCLICYTKRKCKIKDDNQSNYPSTANIVLDRYDLSQFKGCFNG